MKPLKSETIKTVTNPRQVKRLLQCNYVLYCSYSGVELAPVASYRFSQLAFQVKPTGREDWVTPSRLWAELALQLTLF